jgi:hypothetical protein
VRDHNHAVRREWREREREREEEEEKKKAGVHHQEGEEHQRHPEEGPMPLLVSGCIGKG